MGKHLPVGKMKECREGEREKNGAAGVERLGGKKS